MATSETVSAGSSLRAIRGGLSQGNLVETSARPPLSLATTVNRKINQLIESGADLIQSNDGVVAILEAPVSIFSQVRTPSVLKELTQVNAQDRMRVTLISRGYGLDGEPVAAHVKPSVGVEFGVFPNLRTKAPISWRIDQKGNELPTITLRHDLIVEPIPYDARFARVFSRGVELAKKHWGGIEDYVADLKDLAKNDMTPENFAKVEDAMRFSDEHLAGLNRESGEPAIEHSYRAVRDFMLAGEFDWTHLATLALHDAWEDGPQLKQKGVYSPWFKKAKAYISRRFEQEIARRVLVLTRPRRDGKDILSDQEAREMYTRNMSRDPYSAYDKIPDRLDNVETLDAMPVANQIKTIKETIVYMQTIFMNEKVRAVNPKVWKILMRKLVAAMEPYSERYRTIKIPEDVLALKK